MFGLYTISRRKNATRVDRFLAVGTACLTDPSEEQTQMIENFRGTAYGGPGTRHTVSLFDGDRGREIRD